MKLAFIGPPLSGKGSAAKLLNHEYQFIHISTGDLFREEINKQSDEGLKAKAFMEAGALVPDELTLKILQKRLARLDQSQNFVLDGFPRTLKQAEELNKILQLDKVVYFDASDELLTSRLLGRITCSHCGTPYHLANVKPKVAGICDYCGKELVVRSDDTLEAFKIRLVAYKEQTAPVILYYQNNNLLMRLDASLGSALLCKQILEQG